MALLRVDDELVHKLLVTALADIETSSSGLVSFVPPGRPQPDGDETTASTWCSVVRVQCTPTDRKKDSGAGGGSETDTRMLTAAVNVHCNGAAVKANAYALGRALSVVAGLISEVRLVDSPLTHVVDLDAAETMHDPAPTDGGGGRGLAGGLSGAVIVTGRVQRVA